MNHNEWTLQSLSRVSKYSRFRQEVWDQFVDIIVQCNDYGTVDVVADDWIVFAAEDASRDVVVFANEDVVVTVDDWFVRAIGISLVVVVVT